VNTRYREDEDFDEESGDREISLGAPTILGIFFLIALVCAIFFGFGYGIGRKSSIAVGPTTNTVEASSIKVSGAAKPAPGLASPETSVANTDADSPEASTPQLPQPEQPVASVSEPEPAKKPAAIKSLPSTPTPVAVKAAPVTSSPAPRTATALVAAGVPALVQVAAVSHQEDADILLNALKRRGYSVAVRHEPQDKLLHVQIGPLSTRKDADAMRQRLLADGYNAIVK
jgi:cell division septation protein DedD